MGWEQYPGCFNRYLPYSYLKPNLKIYKFIFNLIYLNAFPGELTVRVWDTETNDNYVLPTSMKLYTPDDKSHTVNEIFTCLSYSKLNQTLCAGTNIGRIYFWMKKQNLSELDNPEDSWELNNVNTISGTIKQLMWGSVMLRLPLLSVNCVTSVYIMKEQSICHGFSERIWATQKTASQVLLETDKSNRLLQLESQVTDLAVSGSNLALTNGRTVMVYEINWIDCDGVLGKKSSPAQGKIVAFYNIRTNTFCF